MFERICATVFEMTCARVFERNYEGGCLCFLLFCVRDDMREGDREDMMEGVREKLRGRVFVLFTVFCSRGYEGG